jgi:hypothetical protein
MGQLRNNELKSVWKEAVVSWFGVLYRSLPGETDENHKTRGSGYTVSRSRFEPGISHMQVRNVTVHPPCTAPGDTANSVDLPTWINLKSSVFWDRMSCRPFKVDAVLANCFMLVSCVPYFSILKTEATCSSEKSVDFQRRYIPEDRTLHQDRCEDRIIHKLI